MTLKQSNFFLCDKKIKNDIQKLLEQKLKFVKNINLLRIYEGFITTTKQNFKENKRAVNCLISINKHFSKPKNSLF